MLAFNDNIKIMLAVEPVDFRKGVHSLLALCRIQLERVVQHDTWYVFTNKRKVAIKVVAIDTTGCWLATKYFDKGKLAFLPSVHAEVTPITAIQLEMLVNQRHPISAHYIGNLSHLSGHL